MDLSTMCPGCARTAPKPPVSVDVSEQLHHQRRPHPVYPNTCHINDIHCTERCIVVTCDDEHFGAGANVKEAENLCVAPECEELCETASGDPSAWPCDMQDCSFEELFQCCLNEATSTCPPQCSIEHPQSWQWPHPEAHPDTNVICNAYDCNTMHENPLFHQLSMSNQTPNCNEMTAGPSSSGVQCMWGDCTTQFHNQNALLSHIQTNHLLGQLAHSQLGVTTNYLGPAGSYGMTPQFQPEFHHEISASKSVPCLWGDCGANLDLPIPTDHQQCSDCYNPYGDFSKLDTDTFIRHLLSSHFTPQDPSRDQSIDSSNDASGSSHESSSASTAAISPVLPHSVTQTPPGSTCICKWEGCNLSFLSEDELTNHIADSHVGQGKSVYECLWEGCDRHGNNAFPSKQKVMRHMQKHSGYKPHICEVCNERFAEATSLQQHMRRHTQERPYVCDFPGCGKSFSIPGGLRIHKRAHSGEKPFKCSEPGCGKAFAESSNLAKHMRIHTGVKPFHCTHPGCGRSFGRKDQLMRHATMHQSENKKNVALED